LFIQNVVYKIHEVKAMQTTEVTEHRNMQFYSKNKHSIYLAMQAYMISSTTTIVFFSYKLLCPQMTIYLVHAFTF